MRGPVRTAGLLAGHNMIWAGNQWVEETVCQTCYQPECTFSTGVSRPAAGCMPSRLDRGAREYRGYCEWAVHPDEASFLLHRGYAIVDGQRAMVEFIHNEAFVTQLRVTGSESQYVLEEKWFGPTQSEKVIA